VRLIARERRFPEIKRYTSLKIHPKRRNPIGGSHVILLKKNKKKKKKIRIRERIKKKKNIDKRDEKKTVTA